MRSNESSAVAIILAVVFGIVGETAAQGIPPLFFFKDGTIGVNFFGYKASAGFSGLNGGPPGLHAEAETPFGHKAGAGLAGNISPEGKAGGQLFAGATAGGDVKAAAGLAGALDGNGESPMAVGGYYSAASAGGAKTGKSVAGGVSDQGSVKVVERVAEAPPLVAATATKSRFVKTKTLDTGNGGSALFNFFSSPGVESRAASEDSPTSVVKVPTKNRSFYDDIFNIPISTLGAVSRFLSNNAPKKTPPTVEVQKTITTF